MTETSVKSFTTRVHGKWIMLGEHAVIRGAPAIAFPVYGKYLELNWKDESGFSAKFAGERGAEFQLLFTGVFDRALEILGRPGDVELRRGLFSVESTLPVGAGLGASAALAVAVGRWFVWMGAIAESDLFDFCRKIEDLFHGESSGIDVAVAIENRGLHFQRLGEDRKETRMRGFDPAWQPIWYISYSGVRGITSECVSQVKKLIHDDPTRGQELDSKMARAVQEAEAVLREDTNPDRVKALAHAIESASSCFEEWGLAGGELGRHMNWLRESGAVAVKPTGSGGGGYALSLWNQRPPREIEEKLIPVFRS